MEGDSPLLVTELLRFLVNSLKPPLNRDFRSEMDSAPDATASRSWSPENRVLSGAGMGAETNSPNSLVTGRECEESVVDFGRSVSVTGFDDGGGCCRCGWSSIRVVPARLGNAMESCTGESVIAVLPSISTPETSGGWDWVGITGAVCLLAAFGSTKRILRVE